MPITHSNSDLAPEKLSRKESSELDYGSCPGTGLRDPGGTNSNGTLNILTEGNNNNQNGGQCDQVEVEFSDACFNSVKAFFRNKAVCGLEDCFWILFLVNVIAFLVIKATTRHTFPTVFYMWLGCCAALIALYCLAAVVNKFVFEDSTTAHWNAHARFTQAAIQERLKEEEMKVHVIAPPKMGGAKLNILYTVGDVPLARDNSGRSSGGRPSSGSLGLSGAGPGSSSSGTPTTAVAFATTALVAPAALSSAVAGISSTPNSPPQPQPSTSNAPQSASKTPPLKATGKPPLEAISDASEPSTSSSASSSISSTPCKPSGSIGIVIKPTSSVQPPLLPETIDEESDDRIESPVDDITSEERKSLLTEVEKKQQ